MNYLNKCSIQGRTIHQLKASLVVVLTNYFNGEFLPVGSYKIVDDTMYLYSEKHRGVELKVLGVSPHDIANLIYRSFYEPRKAPERHGDTHSDKSWQIDSGNTDYLAKISIVKIHISK